MTNGFALKKAVTGATIAFMAFTGLAAGVVVERLVDIGPTHEGALVVAALSGLGIFATGTLAFLSAMALAGHIKVSVIE